MPRITVAFGVIVALIAVVASTSAGPAAAATLQASDSPQVRKEQLSGGVDIELTTYAADGDYLAVWIAPSFGFRQGQREMASALSRMGIAIWQADVSEALFLPKGSSGMRALDGTYVADLVERAHRATGKKIVLISSSYGAIPVLRGARIWQTRQPGAPYLIGAVLFSPNLYASVPELGQLPQYLPITQATNIPIMVFQGGANANRWQLERLLETLRSGGSTVYVDLMPGVTGLFFDEEDEPRSAAIEAEFRALPQRLRRVLPLLERTGTPLQPVQEELETKDQPSGSGLDAELQPYRGEVTPQPIRLRDTEGRLHTISDYKGKVTVVNFWATWCPPCVEEIPSLNRLREKIADERFRLVSVNYAETPETVRAFMEKVRVDYPVLLDRTGEVSAQWNVVVFPSTFVIGPQGRIRYGVNAAIRWDAPALVEKLRALLDG